MTVDPNSAWLCLRYQRKRKHYNINYLGTRVRSERNTSVEDIELYCYNIEGDRNSLVSQVSCQVGWTLELEVETGMDGMGHPEDFKRSSFFSLFICSFFLSFFLSFSCVVPPVLYSDTCLALTYFFTYDLIFPFPFWLFFLMYLLFIFCYFTSVSFYMFLLLLHLRKIALNVEVSQIKRTRYIIYFFKILIIHTSKIT